MTTQTLPVLPPRVMDEPAAVTATWSDTAPADEIEEYYDDWTERPVIQAVFFAWIIPYLAAEIKELVGRFELVGPLNRTLYRNHESSPDDALVGATYLFHGDYYIKQDNLFRVHELDEPSAPAIDAALRVLSPWDKDLPDAWTKNREQVRVRCLSFVESLRSDWGFRVKETAEAPSVFSTMSALSGIRNALHHERSGLPTGLDRIARHLVSRDAQRQGIYIRRQARNDNGIACLSTTEHVYRLANMLRNLATDAGLLDRHLHANGQRILEFVRACWDADSGGFRVTEGANRPDLTHTRVGLQLLREMLVRGHIAPSDLHWLDLDQVVLFVGRCWHEHGFATVPGGQPSICSLRDALGTLKNALLFKLNRIGSFSYDRQWALAEATAHQATQLASMFIDDDGEVVYAYPRAVIEQWASAGAQPGVHGGSLAPVTDIANGSAKSAGTAPRSKRAANRGENAAETVVVRREPLPPADLLRTLYDEDLLELVRRRLEGAPTALPGMGRDEDPSDVLVYLGRRDPVIGDRLRLAAAKLTEEWASRDVAQYQSRPALVAELLYLCEELDAIEVVPHIARMASREELRAIWVPGGYESIEGRALRTLGRLLARHQSEDLGTDQIRGLFEQALERRQDAIVAFSTLVTVWPEGKDAYVQRAQQHQLPILDDLIASTTTPEGSH